MLHQEAFEQFSSLLSRSLTELNPGEHMPPDIAASSSPVAG